MLKNLATLFSILLAIFFAIAAPISHNPDASYYYGVALRVSQGMFSFSVDGLYGPLLSWLIAIPTVLGLDLSSAFRVVNLCAFTMLMLGCRCLCKRFNLSDHISALLLLIIGVQLSYFTVVFVTSDLLLASLYIWFCLTLLKPNFSSSAKNQIFVGLLGALAYLAKATQLYIIIVTLLALWLSSRLILKDRSITFAALLRTTLSLLIFCAPWVLILSLQYGQFTTSAQFILFGKPQLLEVYSPGSQILAQSSAITGSIATASFAEKLAGNFNTAKAGLQHLANVSADLLYSQEGWYCLLLLVFLGTIRIVRFYNTQSAFFTLMLIAAIHCCAIAVTWGAYIRYYFPVLPLLYLLAYEGYRGIESVFKTLFSRLQISRWNPAHFSAALILCFYCLALVTTARAIISDWPTRDDNIITQAITNPILQNSKGIIIGNRSSPYPCAIAYKIKRECWNFIRPGSELTTESLRLRLQQQKVSQVLWFDNESYPILDTMPNAAKHGPFQASTSSYYIYDIQLD